MRLTLAVAAMAVISGCQQQTSQVPGATQSATLGGGGAVVTGPLLLRYLPPERGGPEAYPEAQVGGTLDLGGPCVRLRDHHGVTQTLVSSPGPRVGRDAAGPFIETEDERLRHGAPIWGGGGWFSHMPQLGPLETPIPEACRSSRFVVITGMQRHDPADEPPLKSPPPPPVDQ